MVERYRGFKDQCRIHKVELYERMEVKFFIQIPDSWSKKKKKEHHLQPHRQRPDLDNLQKSLQDSVLQEDCRIHEVRASKVWSHWPGIEVGEITDD
jgi:Holliday junction resolvase RusA-like endonuclease